MVDLDAEVAKLDKKLGLAQMSAEKIRKLQEQPDYEKNLPENVREANAEKVSFNLPHLCMRFVPNDIFGVARDIRCGDCESRAVD